MPARNLIIVAGHAMVRDWSRVSEDAGWHLYDYQAGDVPGFLGHIRRGVELAAADPAAMLLFSGGQTRWEAGPVSEAESYFGVAERFGWWGHDVQVRAGTEEFARDSFENLLFSIARFREMTGRYPDRVTLISWAFKRERFHQHREAIRWPHARFEFDGPNDPAGLAQALEAEARAREAYAADPYSGSEMFAEKRKMRNPFGRLHPYAASSPALGDLFAHRGPGVFTGRLPWD